MYLKFWRTLILKLWVAFKLIYENIFYVDILFTTKIKVRLDILDIECYLKEM